MDMTKGTWIHCMGCCVGEKYMMLFLGKYHKWVSCNRLGTNFDHKKHTSNSNSIVPVFM